MPILGDFAVKYGAFGEELGVPTDDLYQALVDTAENTVSLHTDTHLIFKTFLMSRHHSLRIGTLVNRSDTIHITVGRSLTMMIHLVVKLADKTRPGSHLGISPRIGWIRLDLLGCLLERRLGRMK